jgi:hypothetical protein
VRGELNSGRLISRRIRLAMRIAKNAPSSKILSMSIKEVSRFLKANADSIERTLLRMKYELLGVHFPPRFSLGKGTRFVLLADCELRMGNELNLGD